MPLKIIREFKKFLCHRNLPTLSELNEIAQ